jgi:hypothetical protein
VVDLSHCPQWLCQNIVNILIRKIIWVHVGNSCLHVNPWISSHITMQTPRYLKHIIGVPHVEVLCRPYIFIQSRNHTMNLWSFPRASQSFSNILVSMILASTHLAYAIAHGFGKHYNMYHYQNNGVGTWWNVFPKYCIWIHLTQSSN